jgi:hypothetical protein
MLRKNLNDIESGESLGIIHENNMRSKPSVQGAVDKYNIQGPAPKDAINISDSNIQLFEQNQGTNVAIKEQIKQVDSVTNITAASGSKIFYPGSQRKTNAVSGAVL